MNRNLAERTKFFGKTQNNFFYGTTGEERQFYKDGKNWNLFGLMAVFSIEEPFGRM